ncbi:TPA: hypothetical protein ACTGGA_003297, partial [Legionella pneumophila]
TLIMRTGHAPVKAAQMVWYLDTTMKHLACGSTEVPRQNVTHHPFVHQASDKSLMPEALEL